MQYCISFFFFFPSWAQDNCYGNGVGSTKKKDKKMGKTIKGEGTNGKHEEIIGW
jgi:hypothetical protein